MAIQRIHHVAYRCPDAAKMVAFFKSYQGLAVIGAFAEGHLPSPKVQGPYRHVFLDAGAAWSKTKQPPRHMAWTHEIGFQGR